MPDEKKPVVPAAPIDPAPVTPAAPIATKQRAFGIEPGSLRGSSFGRLERVDPKPTAEQEAEEFYQKAIKMDRDELKSFLKQGDNRKKFQEACDLRGRR